MFELYENVRLVDVDGVGIAVTEHGPEDGVPVLLIHGFPDSARLWRHQVPVLAGSGYRVLTPDVRGYGRSDRPEGVESYLMSALVGDMVAVLDNAGVDRAHVVGHDWGSVIAWALALRHPERLRSLTALSVGHPTAFVRAGLAQRQKSWYVLLFQFEGVAERWLSDNDWYWLRRWTETDEVEHWIEDLGRPGALTAGLNFYRANMPPESVLRPVPQFPPLDLPVLGVWSTGDTALTESQMMESGRYVSGEWRYERFDDCAHWIPVEKPDRLNRLLLEWFEGH